MADFEPLASDVLACRCLKHATIPPTIIPPETQECGLCMRDEGILVGRQQSNERLSAELLDYQHDWAYWFEKWKAAIDLISDLKAR